MSELSYHVDKVMAIIVYSSKDNNWVTTGNTLYKKYINLWRMILYKMYKSVRLYYSHISDTSYNPPHIKNPALL
jgi:heptaprenylglyceryl phosphate synthase